MSPELSEAVERARKGAREAGELLDPPTEPFFSHLSAEVQAVVRAWRHSGDFDQVLAEVIADDPDFAREKLHPVALVVDDHLLLDLLTNDPDEWLRAETDHSAVYTTAAWYYRLANAWHRGSGAGALSRKLALLSDGFQRDRIDNRVLAAWPDHADSGRRAPRDLATGVGFGVSW
jgi:hypothetical protein